MCKKDLDESPGTHGADTWHPMAVCYDCWNDAGGQFGHPPCGCDPGYVRTQAALDPWIYRPAFSLLRGPDLDDTNLGMCEDCGRVEDWTVLHSATPGVYCDGCASIDGWDCDCDRCAVNRSTPGDGTVITAPTAPAGSGS
ncbi:MULTISPECIES: hypothetical protein [unclassified Modestobacter]|uniref:hypothetical protein n=1 Tax=unclassified Modestobacter TaxID=2643866 RepID=UPI0022AAA6BE|nr:MULTISPECIES: hypothetical protein [unclassified Modestobacter]MCZ2825989.1 hypothetical protein [Modestobacter sp. VKM Ac-2981]MCZ2852946.1 hypothetical protein [Modestobacter sp. VKM Ac-2982]